jgi:hypothetical protein
MSNLRRFAVVVFLLGNGISPGQEGSPLNNVPAPKPPFVARAPAQSSWLILITPNANGPDAAPSNPAHPAKFLKAQLWTKAGTAMQCANEWSDGTMTEDTVVGPTKLAQSPDGNGVHIYNPRLNPLYHDFSTGDFEMLDWITLENYVGAFSHAGERCYLFRTKGAKDAASAPHNQSLAEINTPASPTSVYISIQTGLPVEIDNAHVEYLFQFGSPGELKLPETPPAPTALSPPPESPVPAPPPSLPKPEVKTTPPPPPTPTPSTPSSSPELD